MVTELKHQENINNSKRLGNHLVSSILKIEKPRPKDTSVGNYLDDMLIHSLTLINNSLILIHSLTKEANASLK